MLCKKRLLTRPVDIVKILLLLANTININYDKLFIHLKEKTPKLSTQFLLNQTFLNSYLLLFF